MTKSQINAWDTFCASKEATDLAIAQLHKTETLLSELRKIRGGIKVLGDQRAYFDALCETFPHLYQIVNGRWSEEEQDCLLRLGRTAIAHGSAPMSKLFLLLCSRLDKAGWMRQEFTEKERSRLEFLQSLY